MSGGKQPKEERDDLVKGVKEGSRGDKRGNEMTLMDWREQVKRENGRWLREEMEERRNYST